MHHKYDVSLILACYNEAEIFTTSVKQIIQVLDKTNWTWEIIFIDDNSQDNTAKLVKQTLSRYPRKHLSAYVHHQNQGRGKTVSAGFLKAQGKIVGYIDIDLEIPAWYIPRFVEGINQHIDGTVAHRVYDLNVRGIWRWIFSKGYVALRQLIMPLPIYDTEAGYKFFKRDKILPIIKKCTEPRWFWDTEIIARSLHAKISLTEIPVVFIRRHDKTSTVRLLPDTIDYLIKLFKHRRTFNQS